MSSFCTRPTVQLAFAALLVAAVPAYAEDIVVGVPISLTGVTAFVGNPGKNAIILAAEQANAAGTLGKGRTIKLVIDDDASERGQAITLANRMILNDHALIIVGAAGTSSALAGGPVANEHKVPMIALATSPAITAIGPYAFHIMASPDLQMEAVTRYGYDHYKPKTVATVWVRDNEGAVAQGKFVRQWMQGKATLLPEEGGVSADNDFSVIATKLAGENPDVIFATMTEATSANLIAQARQAGVKSQFLSTTAVVGPGFLRIGGPAVEGTIAPADYVVGRPDQLNKDFVAAYTKRFGEAPDNWAADGYMAMEAAIRAIAAAGPNPTGTAVRDAITKIKNVPAVIGDGKFSFDDKREPAYNMAIVQVKGGAWTLAPK